VSGLAPPQRYGTPRYWAAIATARGDEDSAVYEVDEAATRIREEVDQDANIIVGATFDESLDGMIRVSVVATGIDQALAQRPGLSGLGESRLADIGPRLRAEKQRDSEGLKRLDSVRASVAASPASEIHKVRSPSAEDSSTGSTARS